MHILQLANRKTSKRKQLTFNDNENRQVKLVFQNIMPIREPFMLTVKNIKSASGVEEVLIPVWCAENQNDLVWYKAEKIDNTTYRVNVNIANHKNHEGIYKADVYVKTGNGIQAGIGRSTLEIKRTELYALWAARM